MLNEPWFINQELRWLRAAEAEQLELDTVERMLAPRGLVCVGRSKRPDGIVTIYVVQRKNSKEGEDPQIKICGRTRPMTESELREHLGQQIEEAIARRNFSNWKLAAQKETQDSHEGQASGTENLGGALVKIAEEMSLNAAGLTRQDDAEAIGGPLVAMAEVWAQNAAGL